MNTFEDLVLFSYRCARTLKNNIAEKKFYSSFQLHPTLHAGLKVVSLRPAFYVEKTFLLKHK